MLDIKIITPEKSPESMKSKQYQLEVGENICQKAYSALERMLKVK